MQLYGVLREGLEHVGQRGDKCGLLADAQDETEDARDRRIRIDYQDGGDVSQQGHWVCLHV